LDRSRRGRCAKDCEDKPLEFAFGVRLIGCELEFHVISFND